MAETAKLSPHAPAPEKPPGNTPAGISMLVGFFFCVPFAGIVALIYGIKGLRLARDKQVGGEMMALTGIVFGLIGTMLCIMTPIVVWKTYQARELATPFFASNSQVLIKIGDADLQGTLTQCDSSLDTNQLRSILDRIDSLGELRTIHSSTGGNVQNFPVVEIDSLLVFNKSTEQITIFWKNMNGQNKIVDIRMKTTDPDPTTQPTTLPSTR